MEVHLIGKCDVTRAEVYDLRAFSSACGEFSLHAIRLFQNFVSLKGSESGEGHFPSQPLRLSRPSTATSNQQGKRKEEG
jgi:hypothetical protein